MSAIGTKRTWPSALHMSAFGGKADMTFCTANVCFRPKADIANKLFVGQLAVAFMQTCDRKDAIPIYIATGWYHDKTAASQK